MEPDKEQEHYTGFSKALQGLITLHAGGLSPGHMIRALHDAEMAVLDYGLSLKIQEAFSQFAEKIKEAKENVESVSD